MGASASTNKSTSNIDIISTAYNKCPAVGVSSSVNISNVTFRPNANCGSDTEFVIDQNAGVDATCVIDNLQNSTASIAAELSSQAQAGIGLSASTNVADIDAQIKNRVANTCGNVSSTVEANIKDTVIESCKLR